MRFSSLLLPLLLLIISLLFASCRGRSFVALLLDISLSFIAADILGMMGLHENVPHRARRKCFPRRVLNAVDRRTAIRENSPLMSVNIYRPAVEVLDDVRAIDDGRVVYNKIVSAPEMVVEIVDATEYKKRGSHDRQIWPARSPADVIIAVAPDHPGRSPFGSRNPHPANAWVIVPTAVVIAGPCPWLITLPIPTGVAVVPITNRVRFPARRDFRWMPAAAVVADLNPRAVRGQRRVKIGDRVDLYAS